MAKKDKTKIVKEIAKELVTLLKVEAKVEVKEDRENQAVMVQFETEAPGLLIGHHGETLNALQILLGILSQREFGEWSRVLVNVGDWRQKREETIKALASRVAQKVKYTGAPQAIPDLNASERRIIHLFLADDPDVTTESEGEGKVRQLVVKPRPLREASR